jgi:hypothetical protein
MVRSPLLIGLVLGTTLLVACSSSGGGGGATGGDGGDGTSGSATSGSGTSSSGSGGPQGEAVDCSWFAQPDNCWAQTVAKATACAPPGIITDDPNIPNNVGVFASDRLSCTYDEGVTVTFAEPVPNPDSPEMLPFADYVWDFVVNDPSGAPCVSRSENEEPFTIHLAEGDFSMGLVGPPEAFEYQISCPDGSQYHIPYATLSECWTGFDNGPAAGFFSAGNFVTYSLYGGGFEEQGLFLCK